MSKKKLGLIVYFVVTFFGVAGFTVSQYPDLLFFQDQMTLVFIVLLALPAFYGLGKWIGWKRTALVIGTLSFCAYLFEAASILTGVPYGYFSYGTEIGTKLFGLVPWTVPFAWVPLVIGCFALASQFRTRIPTIFLGAFFLVLLDGLLDPGAVRLGMWTWMHPGWYYVIPISNYIGWILTGMIGIGILGIVAKRPNIPPPKIMYASLVGTLLFWVSVSIWEVMIFPGLIGSALLIFIWTFVYRPAVNMIE